MRLLTRMKVVAMAAVCAMAVALESRGEVTFQGKTVTRIDEAGNVAGLEADCDRSLSVYPFE